MQSCRNLLGSAFYLKINRRLDDNNKSIIIIIIIIIIITTVYIQSEGN